MPIKPKKNRQGSELLTPEQVDTLTNLSEELRRLNRHRFIRMHNSLWRLLTFNFMRGLAFGLGSVMGATVLLSIVVYWLAQFEWVPLVGDWLGQLADEIDPKRPDH
ncbi:DUF5665 domain-containing protein [Roseovarius sp. CAU 1744]|uniref:DUF5665 domain-containing protein n=1 Tax=Roseovarius sp. CAU 1744 TaxID=3140368 RepID=UPI00325A8F77